MKLKRYNQFFGLESLNENLDKAKKFLKEREMLIKVAKELRFMTDDMEYEFKEGSRKSLTFNDFTPEQQQAIKMKLRDIRLSDEEIRNLEKDPEFIKLRELLSDNLGYLYNFTYMYFVEMTPFNEIESMYNDILEYKNLLGNMKDLPEVGKNFDLNFINTKIPNEKEHRTNAEILAEGLEGLKSYRQVKKILDTLTPKLKKSYKDAPVLLKEEFAKIAKAFDELPEKVTDTVDEMTGKKLTVKDQVWRNFFGKMGLDTNERTLAGNPNPRFGKWVFQSRLRRFEEDQNPIRALIDAAKVHLESSTGSDYYSDRIEKINQTQDRFGKNGADIVFNEKGIIIVEVMTYAANKFLNSHTTHCIVNYNSYWDSYLGEYNKQYYIYNTNLPNREELSTIGITIQPGRTWSGGACQGVTNRAVGGQFKSTLKSWEKEYGVDKDLFDVLEPMSGEEIERRKKAKEAEREIVRKGISIEKIKEYVREYGADINKDGAKALRNAVEEDDIEKAKVCLELGASPNHTTGSDAIISKAQNIDMIKLLVSHGSEMTGSVFSIVIHDIDALEYCLKAGMDPNFGNFFPARAARTGSYKSRSDIGEAYMESYKLLIKYGLRIEQEKALRFIRWLAEYARIEMIEYTLEVFGLRFSASEWLSCKNWLKHGDRVDDESREKILNYLQSKHDEEKEKEEASE